MADQTFTCRDCGASFALAQTVLDRFPGWTPPQCRTCRDRKGAASAAPSRPRGRSVTASQQLTTLEVMDRFDQGPRDGVFTDGSSVPNPGPGGWGAVYVIDGEVMAQAHGHDPDTTNNRMELQALISGADLVPAGTSAVMYTDSNLCVQTINEWAAGWAARGWKRKTGPIKNLELVQELYAKVQARPELSLEWIRAHSGYRWNEYADALSTAWMRDEV